MAKLIGFGRGLGKTTMSILESHATGRYIICADNRMADETFRLAKKLGYTIPHPISVTSKEYLLIMSELQRAEEGVIVDNVEMVLAAMLGCEIGTITFNSHNVQYAEDRYIEELAELKKEVNACYKEKQEDQAMIEKLRSICLNQQEVIMDYEWDKLHRSAIARAKSQANSQYF